LFADYGQPFLSSTLGQLPFMGLLFRGAFNGIGILAAGLILSMMILPFIASVMRDVFEIVPAVLKESAYGLGCTTWEVVTRIVLPYTKAGVVGGVMLGLGRALGETMAVTLAAGSNPDLTLNPAKSIETMTAYIVTTASGDAATGSVRYTSIFAVGVTLFAFTMVMNLIAVRLVRRFRQVYS
jgi:phosphate transport system permease protein